MYRTRNGLSESRMDKQYREMVNTRRLYKFEGEFFNLLPYRYMNVQMNLTTLRNIANILWNGENTTWFSIPEVRFGKGLYHGSVKGQKYYYSWCDRQTIELAPTQRDILTLIHEMVHALGYGYHDSKFVGKYIEMLVKYAGVPKKELIQGMQRYKVALPRKYKRLYKTCQDSYKVPSRSPRKSGWTSKQGKSKKTR
jgi:hypothetical protein